MLIMNHKGIKDGSLSTRSMPDNGNNCHAPDSRTK